MPAPYTGVGAHVVQSLSPTIQEYSDLDDLNAANLVPPIRTILDHIALIWKGQFIGQDINLPGIIATGGTNSPGIIVQSGSGNQRGALNLVAQSPDPTVPSDGDIWVDNQTIKASLGGATRTMAALGRLNTFTVFQTFNAGLSANNARIQSVGAPTQPSDAARLQDIPTIFYTRVMGSLQFQNANSASLSAQTTMPTYSTVPVPVAVVGWSSNIQIGGATANAANGQIQVPAAGTYRVRAAGKLIETEPPTEPGSYGITAMLSIRVNSITQTESNQVGTWNGVGGTGGPGSLAGNVLLTWEGVLAANDVVTLGVYNLQPTSPDVDQDYIQLTPGFVFEVERIS